jgi:hypothetical protein
MAFTRGDLYYKDYSWTAYRGDDPRVSGPPDDTLLSRKEGYEMVYFVNAYCNSKGNNTTAYGQRVERAIREKVPSNLHSQKNVKNWLDQNQW